MKNSDLLKYYQEFGAIFKNYIQVEEVSNNRKTKKEREIANRRLSSILKGFEIYVERSPELFNFLTSKGINVSSKVNIWNEFLTHRFFKGDLENTLDTMKRILDEK